MTDQMQNNDQDPASGDENPEELRRMPPPTSRSGFRKMVRRIQLAQEFSKHSKEIHEENDCFPDDIKPSNAASNALRRRSKAAALLRRKSSHFGGSSTRLSIASEKSDSLDGSSKKQLVQGEIKFSSDEEVCTPSLII